MSEIAAHYRWERMVTKAKEQAESGLSASLTKAFEIAQGMMDADVKGLLVEALTQARAHREDLLELNGPGLSTGSKVFQRNLA
jgi:hypothetical protein